MIKALTKPSLAIVAFFTIAGFTVAPIQASHSQSGSDYCGIRNTTFKANEKILMKVYYSALGGYIGAGEATFTTTLERYNGKPVYHYVGEGKTYAFFDNFFKVRDRYESYADTATLLPYKFIRNVDEGGHKIYNNVSFIFCYKN